LRLILKRRRFVILLAGFYGCALKNICFSDEEMELKNYTTCKMSEKQLFIHTS